MSCIQGLISTYLLDGGDNDHHERIGKIDQQPDLHWLDRCCAGEAGGDRGVDWGKNNHARNVDRNYELVFPIWSDVYRGLVDDVHEDGGEVGHHENA